MEWNVSPFQYAGSRSFFFAWGVTLDGFSIDHGHGNAVLMNGVFMGGGRASLIRFIGVYWSFIGPGTKTISVLTH